MIDILFSIILLPFAALAAFIVLCFVIGVLKGIWDVFKTEIKEKKDEDKPIIN